MPPRHAKACATWRALCRARFVTYTSACSGEIHLDVQARWWHECHHGTLKRAPHGVRFVTYTSACSGEIHLDVRARWWHECHHGTLKRAPHGGSQRRVAEGIGYRKGIGLLFGDWRSRPDTFPRIPDSELGFATCGAGLVADRKARYSGRQVEHSYSKVDAA
jgi:hypothetical protein